MTEEKKSKTKIIQRVFDFIKKVLELIEKKFIEVLNFIYKYITSLWLLSSLFLFVFKSSLFFPIFVVGLFVSLIKLLNKTLQVNQVNEKDKESSNEHEIVRKKFILQILILPFLIGCLSYLVADRVYGSKEVVLIGISEFSYADTIDFAEVYKVKCINKANDILGGYYPGLAFDIVTVAGGYEQLWNALNNKRIDIAFISPYNFASRLDSIGLDEFEDKYELIGGKYTNIGEYYRSGFLVKKEHSAFFSNLLKDIAIPDTSALTEDSITFYLSKEKRSTSGYVKPKEFLDSIPINFKNIKHGSIDENIKKVKSGNKYTACALSNDMWYYIKHADPKLANQMSFFEIGERIPMDAVVGLNERWEDITSLKNDIVDMLKFKNLDRSITRESIIKNSLRYIIQAPMDIEKYEALTKTDKN